MVAPFNELLQNMAQMDVFTGVLPFVLTYIVFFMALKEVPVLSNGDNDKVPALVAVIVAFFVARFIVVNPFYQSFFLGFFGRLTIGLIGFVGLLVLLAFTGYDNAGNSQRWILSILMIVIVGAAFTTSGGFTEIYEMTFGDTNPVEPTFDLVKFTLDSGLIWILLVIGALAWVSSDNDGSGSNLLEELFKDRS